MRRRHGLAGIALIAALGGCAANALRLEMAGTVSSAATAVVDQSNAAIARARAARVAANAALIASDASCSPGSDTVYIYVPNAQFDSRKPPPPLCARPAPAGGFLPRPGYDVAAVSVAPLPEDAIKPTLALIGAIADYQGALAKIVAEPNADVQKELEAIAAKASSAKTLAEGVTGAKLPTLPDLKSKQATSAIALLQFVADLVKEARKTADVRRLVVQRGPQVMAIVPQLREQLAVWHGIVQGTDLATQTNSLLRVYEQEKQLPGSTFDQRRSFIERINAALADEAGLPAKQAALNTVLDEFVAVHAALVDALNGNYTPEMRRRIAKLNEQRLLSALKLAAEAFASWGVL
uniref:hypothetical protein n=1 Tax=uncultured Sphingomonas sp. TaxID=158754 RepID=UPI0035CB1368